MVLERLIRCLRVERVDWRSGGWVATAVGVVVGFWWWLGGKIRELGFGFASGGGGRNVNEGGKSMVERRNLTVTKKP